MGGPVVEALPVDMLTKTSLTAVQSLVYLAQRPEEGPIPPNQIASSLGCSSSYLAKIHTQLSKAGILESHRGAKGGITLARAAARISLREVMEACQGRIPGYTCSNHAELGRVCGYHLAMAELERAVVGSLEKWTLADICDRPGPLDALQDGSMCKMRCVHPEVGGSEAPDEAVEALDAGRKRHV